MKKTIIFLVCVIPFFLSSAYAGDSGFYVGIGGSYALEKFELEETEIGIDFTNSWGLNLKAGYGFSEQFALEFNVSYLPSFDWDGTRVGDVTILTQEGEEYLLTNCTFASDSELALMNYALVGKISPDLGSQKIRPFVTIGLGYMDAENDITRSISHPDVGTFLSESLTDSASDWCLKLGLGMDYYLNDHIALDFEGSYVLGINDVDGLDYFHFTLGIAYHF